MKNIAWIAGALLALMLVAAAPAKDLYDGKNVGNTGFANIVQDDITGNATGWIRYGKEGKCLQATWDIWGLNAGEEYQLKIHSISDDTRLLVCSDTANCGSVPGGSFLVMERIKGNPTGHVGGSTKECRLEGGNYANMMFLLTKNSAPFTTAHTWQNGGEVSAFSIR